MSDRATSGSWRRALLALLALVAATAGVSGSAEQTPAVFALRGIRLIDGLGGAAVEDAVILIQEGRIVAAGSAHVVPTPADAVVVDYAGKTVIPGLISNHAHIEISGDLRDVDGHDLRRNVLRQLRQYEAYGVTTVTALRSNALPLQLRRDLHTGAEQAADLFGADRGIGVPNGAPPAHALPAEQDPLHRPDSPTAARQAVRAMAGRRPELVELWLGDVDGTHRRTMRPEIYRAVIDEAHRHGLRVAAHVHDLENARAVVAAGADVITCGVDDRPVDLAFVDLLRKRGVWYIPTLALDEAKLVHAERTPRLATRYSRTALGPHGQLTDPEWGARFSAAAAAAGARRALALAQRNLETLHEAGVRVGFGAGTGNAPLRTAGEAEHRELALMVDAGLSPIEAITIATSQAAALLGLSDRGVLAPGRWADLIVLEEDPTHRIDATSRVYVVWHRGVPTRALAAAGAH